MRARFHCIRLRGSWLFAAGLAVLAALTVTKAAAALRPAPSLPVIMYHSVVTEPAKAGQYAVTAAALEEDFRALRQAGCVSLTAAEAASRIAAGEPLPEKSVVITFDDGYLNCLTEALPLLERYDLKATAAVIGSCCERYSETPDPNPAYACLDWAQIRELAASGRVEIAAHSYDMHRLSPRKGASRRRGESEEDYLAAFTDDTAHVRTLIEENCGITPTTYAFPYGAVSEEALPALRGLGFTVVLTCSEQINRAELSGGLLILGRFNRPSGISTAAFMKKIGFS